jgi:hypothetical protein
MERPAHLLRDVLRDVAKYSKFCWPVLHVSRPCPSGEVQEYTRLPGHRTGTLSPKQAGAVGLWGEAVHQTGLRDHPPRTEWE